MRHSHHLSLNSSGARVSRISNSHHTTEPPTDKHDNQATKQRHSQKKTPTRKWVVAEMTHKKWCELDFFSLLQAIAHSRGRCASSCLWCKEEKEKEGCLDVCLYSWVCIGCVVVVVDWVVGWLFGERCLCIYPDLLSGCCRLLLSFVYFNASA